MTFDLLKKYLIEAVIEKLQEKETLNESFPKEKDLILEMKQGKMRKMLKIPDGKNIEDVYSSGDKLLADLLKKEKNKNKIMKMLVFASNMNPKIKVLKKALVKLKKMLSEE